MLGGHRYKKSFQLGILNSWNVIKSRRMQIAPGCVVVMRLYQPTARLSYCRPNMSRRRCVSSRLVSREPFFSIHRACHGRCRAETVMPMLRTGSRTVSDPEANFVRLYSHRCQALGRLRCSIFCLNLQACRENGPIICAPANVNVHRKSFDMCRRRGTDTDADRPHRA